MDLAARRSIYLSSLRESTMNELRAKVAELEIAPASAESLKTDCEEKAKRIGILSEDLEFLRKGKDRLVKELKASECIIKTKSDELDGVKGKLTSSEDVQERLRGQIEMQIISLT